MDTVLSSPPVAKRPSGSATAAFTQSLCPATAPAGAPVAASHRRTVESSQPLARRPAPGSPARGATKSAWPLSCIARCSSPPAGAASHTSTPLLLPPAAAKRAPGSAARPNARPGELRSAQSAPGDHTRRRERPPLTRPSPSTSARASTSSPCFSAATQRPFSLPPAKGEGVGRAGAAGSAASAASTSGTGTGKMEEAGGAGSAVGRELEAASPAAEETRGAQGRWVLAVTCVAAAAAIVTLALGLFVFSAVWVSPGYLDTRYHTAGGPPPPAAPPPAA